MTWAVFVFALAALLWRAPVLESYLTGADLGYQLSLGRLVTLGQVPFVDMVFHYGPLTALGSATAIWIHDSLISEVIYCAIGYAGALALLFRLAPGENCPAVRVLVTVAGFFLLARFYKWYYWFFPLVVVYSYLRYTEQPERGSFWLVLGGVLSGLGALYRNEFALVFVVFYLLLLGLESVRRGDIRLGLRGVGYVLGGVAATFTLWIAALFLWGGGEALAGYFLASFTGASGVVREWSTPIPSFDVTRPLSPISGASVAFWLVPMTYVLAIAIGMRTGFSRQRPARSSGRLLAAVGLMGLGIFPQGVYRADVSHLLQVIAPFLVASPLLVSEVWQGTHRAQGFFRFGVRTLVFGYTIVTVLIMVALQQAGGKDYGPLNSVPTRHFQVLDLGPRAAPREPIAAVSKAVKRLSAPDDSILVVALAPQIYYFASRPMSGLLNGYAPGIYDDEMWRQRNLARVQADPPRFVIARGDFSNLPNSDLFRKSQPELYEYLRDRYTVSVFQRDDWHVLARPDEPPKKAGKDG